MNEDAVERAARAMFDAFKAPMVAATTWDEIADWQRDGWRDSARVALEAAALADLFVAESFTSHAGLPLTFKIECDALTDEDIRCCAHEIAKRVPPFRTVEGVPRGGLRLAEALRPHTRASGDLLIVDDVLTTGESMERHRSGRTAAVGAVIFARGPCPWWVTPLWALIPDATEH